MKMMRKIRANVVVTLFVIWLALFGYISYNVYQWANIVNKNLVDTYKNYN